MSSPRRLTIVLPATPRELSPNARVHHQVRARIVARRRRLAALLAKSACNEWTRRAGQAWTPIDRAARVTALLQRAPRRKRDADNALAALKSTLDGLQDAGVVVDDTQLRIEGVRFDRVERKHHERDIITVEEVE